VGNTVTIFDTSREEQAWEDYRVLAAALASDQSLLTDRQHMEALARAERRWKHIFTSRCAA
jgi:hypothetical protein